MYQLTGTDRFLHALSRVPLLGNFLSLFIDSARLDRVADELYRGRMRSLIGEQLVDDQVQLTGQIADEMERLSRVTDEVLQGKTREFRERLREGFRRQISSHLRELERLLAESKGEEDAREILEKVKRAEVDHLVRRELKRLGDYEAFFKRVCEIEAALLDEVLPEAFAVVCEACRRHMGKTWSVADTDIRWEMVPFAVQIMGAIELHRGKVVEMATGEGKTLVALMPLHLNALWGHGAHLVTVNSYLARRDSEWMGHILEFLGLTVGCLDKTDPGTAERRAAYHCDVTYGTNNEFGFDYLRDNMALHRDSVVQRGHHFAIIDEADSILIDEARTPLIISGPAERSSHQYDRLKPLLLGLVERQNQLIARLVKEAQGLIEEGRTEEAGDRLMWCMKGAPKHRGLMKTFEDPTAKKLAMAALDRWTMEKRLPELDDILYFTIDEKGHSIELTERGRNAIAPNHPETFVITDLVDEIAQIEATEPDPAKRAVKKADVTRQHGERSELMHNMRQLLRAYMLFERDVEYVVQDNRVIIVDEFTGRLMTGRRWSDGLHQAVEAKEGVKIERETETYATITVQNYFRLYEKLAGMTGTAETEKTEFDKVYSMAVQRIPTNRPIARVDLPDRVFKTKKEKYDALIDEIEYLHGHGMPVLVGTVSVEVSETVARLLKRRKIACNVLNAKEHQREAEIVARAGLKDAVTIATNMAGRGTDIKLGPGVIRCKCEDFNGVHCAACPHRPPGAEVDRDLPPCGLHVLGSERHESRRIDRQLRGRSGRQGDPGSSQFLLSFEDDLLRLFLNPRMINLIIKMGSIQEGDEIRSRALTKQIGVAQGRLEGVNTDRRKNTYEYDDALNRQRNIVYGERNKVLFASPDDCRRLVLEDHCSIAIEERFFEEYAGDGKSPASLGISEFIDWVQGILGPYADLSDLRDRRPPSNIRGDAIEGWCEEFLIEVMKRIAKAHDAKRDLLGPEMSQNLTQFVILHTIDNDWRLHLTAMDELRQGVGLRGYAQVNPLDEFKKEARQAFDSLMSNLCRQIFERWFRFHPQMPQQAPGATGPGRALPAGLTTGRASPALQRAAAAAQAARRQGRPALPEGISTGDGKPIRPQSFRRAQPKVKPNDPCPCGSGKKYKKCCGARRDS
ncbi:preprotein translocase subunit SecA [Candidatus Sumerlaeota bacterium]|nr:preprotein translocase subunit SecA [Candidatus Sumerlaeota bacterium]